MSSHSNKPAIQSVSQSKVPRNFVLLSSIDRAGQFTNVQYGLAKDDTNINNVKLENWDCTIVFDDGNDLNIFEVKLMVPMNFPDVPPIATFNQNCLQHPRINRMCNQDGTLNNAYLNGVASDWNNNMEIPEYLMWLFNKIKNRY